ncbi:MAG: hypothetical protein EPN62_08585 [Candidimonas sp.]|nr:MAG: hypothetical protein EPN77_05820 [Candidimonas sp.]TAM23723.1 MAG: hypothetical protein EPN62_08585 [Candidimonas sp.]
MNGIDFILADQITGHLIHGQRTTPQHLVTPVRLIERSNDGFPDELIPRVLEMRAAGMTQLAIAHAFGVSTPTISRILKSAGND